MRSNGKEGTIAIDNGGFTTCYYTSTRFGKFPSSKGEYRERTLVSTHGRYDFIMELDGKKYMGGTLAVECEFPMQMHTDSKQNLFFDLSVLTAVHQYGYDVNHVIVSVPISMHSENEKNGIKKRLEKDWDFTVNGETRRFKIESVAVAPETVSAFWIDEPRGVNRWVDWGSRTVGYGTTIHDGETMRFLDTQSGTFKGKGLQAINSNDYESLVDYVCGRISSKWDKNDVVHHLGGGAMNHQIISHFRKYFPNSFVLENPQMANARGMYLLGREVFGRA